MKIAPSLKLEAATTIKADSKRKGLMKINRPTKIKINKSSPSKSRKKSPAFKRSRRK